VVAAAFPWYTIRDLSQMTEQRGLFPVITDACGRIGSNGAVVVLQESQPPQSTAYLGVPQTLRSFCDVPVVVMPAKPRAAVLRRVASQWATKGRRLVVVAENAKTVQRVFPNAQLEYTRVGEESHLLERTLLGPPHRYTGDPFHIAAARQLTIAAVPVG
jgi:hypothetical protein